MKALLAALGILALVGFAGLAQAEEVSGRVASMDSRTLILDNGSAFTIGDGAAIEQLQPGTPVTVSFEEIDGQKVATRVAPKE